MGRLISVDDLTAEERIELMGTLWDGLDRVLAAPITPALAAELDRREAEADTTPDAGDAWPGFGTACAESCGRCEGSVSARRHGPRSQPHSIGTWSGRVRRVLLRRFPYGICCKVYPSTSSVVGVVRGRRHPDTWLGRAAP